MSGDGGGARRCDGAPRRSFVDGSMGRGGDRLRGRAGGGDRFVGGAAPSMRAGGTKGRKTRARGGGLAEKCADRAPVRAGGGDGGFGGGRGFGGGGRGGGARGRDRTEPSRVAEWGSSAVVTVICTVSPACGAAAALASLSVVVGPVRAADAALGVRVIAPAAVPGVDDQW